MLVIFRAADCNLAAPTSVPSVSSMLNPLESADPRNVPVTPVESALPKLLDLKSFIIRTSKKIGGSELLWLTRPVSSDYSYSRKRGQPAISSADFSAVLCSFDHGTMALYTVAPCDWDIASIPASSWFIISCYRDAPCCLLRSNEDTCTKH